MIKQRLNKQIITIYWLCQKVKSFRYLTQKAIQTLVEEIGDKGLWLFNLGFDNWQFFQFLHNLKLRFLIPSTLSEMFLRAGINALLLSLL